MAGARSAGCFDREEDHGAVLRPARELPEGVLNWHQALKRKEPYFHLSPMWHSATWAMEDRNRWYWFENFLNQAATVSRDIEYERHGRSSNHCPRV